MSRQLPTKPNLEHLKKQAKQLLHNFQQGDPVAVEQFQSLAMPRAPESPKLADAQHAIAHDYGFASWPKLKEHVESLTRLLEPREQLSAAVRASNAEWVARLLASHPALKTEINDPMHNHGGMQALLAAVQRTDRKTIDVLLEAGADINARARSWAGGRSRNTCSTTAQTLMRATSNMNPPPRSTWCASFRLGITRETARRSRVISSLAVARLRSSWPPPSATCNWCVGISTPIRPPSACQFLKNISLNRILKAAAPSTFQFLDGGEQHTSSPAISAIRKSSHFSCSVLQRTSNWRKPVNWATRTPSGPCSPSVRI